MTTAGTIDDGRIELDLPLKGERKYLHSTTILSDLVERFSLTGAVKLEFRQMIYHPVHLVAGAQEALNRVGKFSYLDGDAWRSYGIYVDEKRKIIGHVADNEPQILAASGREGDRSWGQVGAPANFIDTIVALNKAVVGSHSPGKKAIFTSIALDTIPAQGEIGISLVKKMGTKIYVSDVLLNHAKIGSLTFMTV